MQGPLIRLCPLRPWCHPCCLNLGPPGPPLESIAGQFQNLASRRSIADAARFAARCPTVIVPKKIQRTGVGQSCRKAKGRGRGYLLGRGFQADCGEQCKYQVPTYPSVSCSRSRALWTRLCAETTVPLMHEVLIVCTSAPQRSRLCYPKGPRRPQGPRRPRQY